MHRKKKIDIVCCNYNTTIAPGTQWKKGSIATHANFKIDKTEKKECERRAQKHILSMLKKSKMKK